MPVTAAGLLDQGVAIYRAKAAERHTVQLFDLAMRPPRRRHIRRRCRRRGYRLPLVAFLN